MKSFIFATKRVMLLLVIAMFSGCSGAPSGSFPKQVGPFTLAEGPVPYRADTDVPASFLSEYKSAGGMSVAHQVIPYPSADAAQKAWENWRHSWTVGTRSDESFTESGNKLIKSQSSGGMTRVWWVNNTWLCNTASRDRDAAIQLANSLPYR